jgi:hypothetical protein
MIGDLIQLAILADISRVHFRMNSCNKWGNDNFVGKTSKIGYLHWWR